MQLLHLVVDLTDLLGCCFTPVLLHVHSVMEVCCKANVTRKAEKHHGDSKQLQRDANQAQSGENQSRTKGDVKADTE